MTPGSGHSNSSSQPRSTSPFSTSSRGRLTPLRSATSPYPSPFHNEPPSPELSNLDCAFPPFPASTPRVGTPVSEKSQPDYDNEYVRHHVEPPLPLPSASIRGSSVPPQEDTIAFGTRRDEQGQNPGHRRTATQSSDKGAPRRKDSGGDPVQRPATSTGHRSRQPSLASISGGPRSMKSDAVPPLPLGPGQPLGQGPGSGYGGMGAPPPVLIPGLGGGKPQLPQGPPPLRPRRPDGHYGGLSPTPEPPTVQPPSPSRSQTFPRVNGPGPGMGAPSGPLPRRPSEPSLGQRNRRPTLNNGSRPPMPAQGPSTGERPMGNGRPPQLEQQMPPPRTASRNGPHNPYLQNAGPSVPALTIPSRNMANEFGVGNPYHTPTESISSAGSFVSHGNTNSSRSSPPLSDAGSSIGRPSDAGHLDGLMNDLLPGNHRNRNGPPAALVPGPPKMTALQLPPDSPTVPGLEQGRLSPIDGPAQQPAPLATRPLKRNGPLAPPPLKNSRPHAPSRKSTNKGKCRGCDLLITGKSVSSADGRLTGRYHKECFVCWTCKEPFQTADFYVHSNHPYCGRHYHELNDTICPSCDRGIEGQYLQTDSKQKYHPHCFTCQVEHP